MKKSIFITTVALVFAVASVGSASPLSDFSTGKASIDLNVRSGGDIEVSAEGDSVTGDAKDCNFEGTITYGLGNNFAIQYRNTTGDSKKYNGTVYYDSYVLDGNINGTSKAQEFNVLYTLNKNFIAYVGWTQAKAGFDASGTVNGAPASISMSGNNTNGYQVGLTGVTNFGAGFNGYATVAAGNHITNYEIGVGYEIAKNCELNIGYKDTKYKDLSISYGGYSYSGYDYEFKGMTYGATYKF
ncbi:MAG: hypothetical protein H6Q67_46 [Firmicutes bacterium]|nr:hypothetical protein [Bacillota bacterium]